MYNGRFLMHKDDRDQCERETLDFNEILYRVMPESVSSLDWVASWLREHNQALLADETDAFASMQLEYHSAMEMTLFVYKALWSLDPEQLDEPTIRFASERCLKRRKCLGIYLTAGSTLKRMLRQQDFVADAKVFTELDEKSKGSDIYCHMIVYLNRSRIDIARTDVLQLFQEHVEETIRPWSGFSGLMFSEEDQKWIIPLEIKRWGTSDLNVMLEWDIPEKIIVKPYNPPPIYSGFPGHRALRTNEII